MRKWEDEATWIVTRIREEMWQESLIFFLFWSLKASANFPFQLVSSSKLQLVIIPQQEVRGISLSPFRQLSTHILTSPSLFYERHVQSSLQHLSPVFHRSCVKNCWKIILEISLSHLYIFYPVTFVSLKYPKSSEGMRCEDLILEHLN